MITIVTSVTVQRIYDSCLGKALKEQDVPFKLIFADTKLEVYPAYNAIPEIDTEYVAFISQDVYLCSSDWLRKAEEYCNSLEDLGVAGFVGWGKQTNSIGYFVKFTGKNTLSKVRYFGKDYVGDIRGEPLSEPTEVDVLDGMLLIVPTWIWKVIKFDAEHFPFHDGGLDYSHTLKDKYHKKVYVLPLPTYENAETTYAGDYGKHGNRGKAANNLRAKWSLFSQEEEKKQQGSVEYKIETIEKSSESEKEIDIFLKELSKETLNKWNYPFSIGKERVSLTAENLINLNGRNIELRIGRKTGSILGITFLIFSSEFPQWPSMSIAVKDECKRTGLSLLLLNSLKEIVRERNLEGIYSGCLKTNIEALKFYIKNGFKIIGEKIVHNQEAYELRWRNFQYEDRKN